MQMPFKSEKQRKFLWSQHPEIARKWTEKYGSKTVEEVMAKKKKK
jgi:hypothetical protein